ncbi:hypothetical protein FRC17_009119 [Serendipita sp. 399]|nr:hypothetical protein FRC17_009119 [Serendipita sp. 399]
MSWTTSPPYSHRSISRQATESTAATTPPPVSSPPPIPKSLNHLNAPSAKPKTPISPQKLAKLANALGVSTPSPVSVPYPLYSPTASGGSNSTTSSPSRYLLHVIPPLHLLLAEAEAGDPYEEVQFRRGTLVPLHPTLSSQMGAIAREYSLPSTGGMILYLITTENDPGPRITDDAWRMLWYRALSTEKDGTSTGKHIARYHSRSMASSVSSPYPSPSSTSGSQYNRSGSPSTDITPASSTPSLDIPITLNPAAALPILAKVEFDIDRRKAPWYELWRHRRRTTSHSMTTSLQLSGSYTSSPSSRRVLQLPLRARSTSPSLAEFKAKYAPTPSTSAASTQLELNSLDGSMSPDGYVQLDDDPLPRRRQQRMLHMGQFTDDPLEDVFPSDGATWSQIRSEQGVDNVQSPTSPHTPDVMIGGRIGSTILNLDGADEDENSEDEDSEDVLNMWKEKHRPTLDNLSAPASPGPSTPLHLGGRSRSASKHVPPPLDLSMSSKAAIPHVEVAPPTASPHPSVQSDLPYLDTTNSMSSHEGGGSFGSNGIQIFVDGTTTSEESAYSGADGFRDRNNSVSSLNTPVAESGNRKSTTGSEEARSRNLDELERRIESLSPRSQQWEGNDEDFMEHQSIVVESPEPTSPTDATPTIVFDTNDESGMSETNPSGHRPSMETIVPQSATLPVPSTKASRRQVSIGGFNAIPGAEDLAQALAAESSSPPLPPIPLDDDNDSDNDADDEKPVPDAKEAALFPPIDLASAAPSPISPAFPLSPDPFRSGPEGASKENAMDSPVSPPPRMSSRFSADSVTSEDGEAKVMRADRAGSVISVKGIRNLWRKSGNSKGNMQPLMSPSILNGPSVRPATPPSFMESFTVPPSPGGYFSPISTTPPVPKLPPHTSSSSTLDPSARPLSSAAGSTHRRSDSGLDPFHFDQESRYPVHRQPSPSQAFPDVVPPSATPEPLSVSTPITPTTPAKKGILKGWGSKGSSSKRASGETSASRAAPGPPPSSFASSTGGSKKGKRPSLTGILSSVSGGGGNNGGHSKQSSKTSISSITTGSKHSHTNNSISGTSYASSSHQTVPSLPTPDNPSPVPTLTSNSSGRASPPAITTTPAGHKASGSNGTSLTPSVAGGEPRKSMSSPDAVAIAAAVAASRERRGTSYIGPADNHHLADAGSNVILWSRSPEVVRSMNEERKNVRYLKDHTFSSNITAIGPDFPSKKVVSGVDVVLFAIPTQNLRAVLKKMHAMLDPESLPLLIFVNKGIEVDTQAVTLEIIADECGSEIAKMSVFLSGPSFAKEIIKRQPTQVSVSSLSSEHAEKAAAVFHQPWFRCYTNDDPIGVELCGAGKNVYAIAAGVAAGLGFENNARAGNLAELTRVGVAYGASPITFLSLAGVGDLFLTCSSEKSRNFTVGYRLGQGESLEYILTTLGSVAEGVESSKGYKKIIDRVGVEAPIANAVYRVLYEGAVLQDVVDDVLNLPRMVEHDLPALGTSPVDDLLSRLNLKPTWR